MAFPELLAEIRQHICCDGNESTTPRQPAPQQRLHAPTPVLVARHYDGGTETGMKYWQTVEQVQCLGGRMPARSVVGTPSSAPAFGKIEQTVPVEQPQHHPAPGHPQHFA